jgi:glutamate racemase
LLPLPRLVEFAERGEFNSSQVYEYLSQELSLFELDNYGELVLGCTHFNYFKDSFRKLLPDHVKLIDGSVGTINQLARVLNFSIHNTPYIDDENVEYFYSGRALTSPDELAKMKKLHDRLEKMRSIQ